MLNIQNVFINPALLMTGIALTGMLWSFASHSRLRFKTKPSKI